MAFQEDVLSGRPAPLRRFRRSEGEYERLQCPEGIAPGEPIPSIEGWVLLLSRLPKCTTTDDVKNLFTSFSDEPEHFGKIGDVRLPVDDYEQCSGWALVELDSKQGFDRAIAELHGCVFPTRYEAEEGPEPRISVAPAFIAEDEAIISSEAAEAPGDKRTREEEADDAGEEAAKRRISL